MLNCCQCFNSAQFPRAWGHVWCAILENTLLQQSCNASTLLEIIEEISKFINGYLILISGLRIEAFYFKGGLLVVFQLAKSRLS